MFPSSVLIETIVIVVMFIYVFMNKNQSDFGF